MSQFVLVDTATGEIIGEADTVPDRLAWGVRSHQAVSEVGRGPVRRPLSGQPAPASPSPTAPPRYPEYTCPTCKSYDRTTLYHREGSRDALLYCGGCKGRWAILKRVGEIVMRPLPPRKRAPIRYSEPCPRCKGEAYLVPNSNPPMLRCRCHWTTGNVSQVWMLQNLLPEKWAELRARRLANRKENAEVQRHLTPVV